MKGLKRKKENELNGFSKLKPELWKYYLMKELKQKEWLDTEVFQRAKDFIEKISEPALFGSTEEKEKALFDIQKSFYRKRRQIRRDFESLFPKRENICSRLMALLFRKLSGSKVVRAPLLVGPPGSGKSFAVEALVEVLNKNGIRTVLIRHTVNFSEEAIKQLEMNLLGTEPHYSNSFPGKLAGEVAKKQIDLVIVFLDEIEKGMPKIYPLLLNFLDPSQPLEDTFLKAIFSEHAHDMRFKTFFIAAANNCAELFSIPELKDRFEGGIEFRAYSPEEKVQLVLQLFPREFGRDFRSVDPKEVENLAKKFASDPDLSFRDLLSVVEDHLLPKKLSNYSPIEDYYKFKKRKKYNLGFISHNPKNPRG